MIAVEGRFQSISFTKEEIDKLKVDFARFCKTEFQLEDIPTVAGVGVYTIIFILAGLGAVAVKSFLSGFFSELGKETYKTLAKAFKETITSKPRGESEVIISFKDINFSIYFLFPDAGTLEQLPVTINELLSDWDDLKIPDDLVLLELEYDDTLGKWIVAGGESKEGSMYDYNKTNDQWKKWKKE